MAKLQIGIAHQPEEQSEGPSAGGRKRRTDVEQITEILTRAGHEVFSVAVDGSRECLSRLGQVKADLLFNLVEAFGDDDTKEPHVAAYYELLGLRYS